MKKIKLKINTKASLLEINRALTSVHCWIDTAHRQSDGYSAHIYAPTDTRLIDVSRALSQHNCVLFAMPQRGF